MFICDKCLEEHYTNSTSVFKSQGTCECCGEKASCSEIKSSLLEPKPQAFHEVDSIEYEDKNVKPSVSYVKAIEYPKVGLRYKHYKGGTYKVLSLAKHSETNEDMVVYKSIEFGSVHVRPLRMWFEVVGTVDNAIDLKLRRFELEIDRNITDVDYEDDFD